MLMSTVLVASVLSHCSYTCFDLFLLQKIKLRKAKQSEKSHRTYWIFRYRFVANIECALHESKREKQFSVLRVEMTPVAMCRVKAIAFDPTLRLQYACKVQIISRFLVYATIFFRAQAPTQSKCEFAERTWNRKIRCWNEISSNVEVK